jgi:hypothetical protein
MPAGPLMARAPGCSFRGPCASPAGYPNDVVVFGEPAEVTQGVLQQLLDVDDGRRRPGVTARQLGVTCGHGFP